MIQLVHTVQVMHVRFRLQPCSSRSAAIDCERLHSDLVGLASLQVTERVRSAVPVCRHCVAAVAEYLEPDLVARDDSVLFVFQRRFPSNNDTLYNKFVSVKKGSTSSRSKL